MRIVALMCVRDGALYVRRCLEHLHAQGVVTCFIDNGSTDGTLEIAEAFRERGVIRIDHLPFDGVFDMPQIMAFKEKLQKEVEADWFMSYDVDEIKEAPPPFATLAEGIAEADRQGYNAINFDEFVFAPTSADESFEGGDFVAGMRFYYHFAPSPLHRINAWKNQGTPADLHTRFGHQAEFPGRKVFPVSFILRHYLALSRAQALAKYAGRVHHVERIRKGSWSDPRVAFAPAKMELMPKARLKEYHDDGVWDRSEPWDYHPMIGRREGAKKDAPVGAQGENRGFLRRAVARLITRRAVIAAPAPFIVGVPRSGTTLLRLMLDAHPELALPAETHFLPALLTLPGSGAELRRRFFEVISQHKRWNDFHLDAKELERGLAAVRPFSVPGGIRCFYRLCAARERKSRWGDKTPGYVLHLRAIQAALPEARFIHILRDGRDVAVSLRHLWWGLGNDIEAQAADWVWRIREARQQAQVCPHYLEVRYEDLVADARKVLEGICAFLELPFADAMMRHHERAGGRIDELSTRYDRQGNTIVTKEQLLEIHERATQPPTADRIGRWKTELTPEETGRYEKVAAPLLRELGYELAQRDIVAAP